MDLGSILGVWGHPDDETYLSAGLMAEAVRRGHAVVCVTATKGELGSWDEERWPMETLGEVRAAELEEALSVLGVTDHRWLDYRDGELEAVPVEEGASQVRAILEEVQPDTVLTFGPDGMTGHPDHRAISAWTTEAFREAGKDGSRLHYATKTPEYADRFVPALARFNVFGPGTPPTTRREELDVDFVLPEDLLETKIKALQAYRSQLEAMLSVYGPELLREEASAEWFVLAEER